MSETNFSDPKPGSDSLGESYLVKTVKRGRTLYGEFRTYVSGKKNIYIAYRQPNHIFKATNSWAIDTDTYNALKIRACTHIFIQVANGDRYGIRFEDFTKKAKVFDYSSHIGMLGKKGAKQWYCPIDQFKFLPAAESEKLAFEIKRVALGR